MIFRRSLPTRIEEFDPVRILVFLIVIAAHVISNVDETTAGGEVSRLLAVGKYAFLTLSACVATWVQLRRPLPLRQHLRQRLPSIVVPFIVWGTLYSCVRRIGEPVDARTVRDTLLSIVLGDGEQHLYFILLVIQLTFLTPLLAALVRRTEGHHRTVVAIAIAGQLVIGTLLRYTPVAIPTDVSWRLLPTFGGFVVVGAVAAAHMPRLLDAVRRHRLVLALTAAAAAGVHVAVFVVERSSTVPVLADRAAHSTSPAHMLWGLALLPAVLALATVVTDRLGRGRAWRSIRSVADLGFGVYLIHPFVISVALELLALAGVPRTTAAAVPVFAMTVVGTLLLAALLARSPIGRWTVGRRATRAAAAPSPRPAT